MKPTKILTIGLPLLVLVLVLLVAGCTQPPGVPVSTATPTPTATPQVTAPVTTAPSDNETLKAEMAALAGTLANTIDKENLSIVMKEGENTTAFAAVLSQLKDFEANDPKITYDYVFEIKNDTFTFVLTNFYGEPGAPEFMETYNNPPEALKTSVTGPVGVGPYTDEYGTFITGLAPIDVGSNTSGLFVGVDYKF